MTSPEMLVLATSAITVLAAGLLQIRPVHANEPSVELSHGDLEVSENGRFLVHADGTAFFWLGDTGWKLVYLLDREEAERYLENRRRKRFTVIQAVAALGPQAGPNTANAYGHRPFLDGDPTRPDVREGPENGYWDHLDWIVGCAGEKGIFIGMLPIFGNNVAAFREDGEGGPSPAKARAYGRWIGARYKDAPNIVWILGGDHEPEGRVEFWRAMAAGIQEGDNGRHLMTYHPYGSRTSAAWFHGDDWLDFNMLQSGHSHRKRNDEMIAADYALMPAKPCVDGEPRYEDHPDRGDSCHGYIDDFDVRKAAYWALFAGAFGHTYGCHDVWQYWQPGRKPVTGARTPWVQAMDLPGADDMRLVRSLLESRPILTRVPDQSLVVAGESAAAEHVWSTRGDDYALLYVIPTLKPITVRLGKISGDRVAGWWYDPREGTHIAIGTFPNTGDKEFTPPPAPADAGRGHDWVLVLDDAAQGYPPPGTQTHANGSP